MPITDQFIFIPSRTKDFRTCVRRRWGGGVDLTSAVQDIWPAAIVTDGADGVFVLVLRYATGTVQRTAELHHVSAAGVRTGPFTITSPKPMAVEIVPSTSGSCIVIWCDAAYQTPLVAQRFDAACQPVWAAPVELAPRGGGFTALGAVEDGADGAFVCYNSGSLATGSGTNFRLQQIDASGTLVLPAAGQQILAAGATPYYAPRMVNTGTALAVLWQSFSGNAPIPVTGAWLDPSGNLTGGPFPVAQCLDMWFWNATTARAVPGGPDGFWVANVFSTGAGLAQVRLQRFDGGAMTPAVTVMGRTLAHAQTYSILQDGSGGVFCITADPAGVVGIERFDVGGRSIWANAHASQFTTIDVSHITMTSATGAALQQVAIGASRLVSIATRWRGGVIAGYEVVPVGIGTRVRFRCFDASGSTVGSESDIGAGAGTQSSTLMIRPRLNLGPATIIPFPPKNPPDPDLVSCIWRTTAAANARIVSTQRLGCCPDVFDVDRVLNPWNYPCAWPVDFPPSIPGVVTVAFPCTRESVGNFGVLPLPQLRGTPGVNIPGGLLSRNVRPPGWVRILFTGVPDDVQIEIQSHDGQRIAKARASATEPRDLNAREVTFKPKAELSYALAFVRPSSDPRDRLTIGISMEFGDGRPGSGEPRRKRKTALRKQSRKRRGRR